VGDVLALSLMLLAVISTFLAFNYGCPRNNRARMIVNICLTCWSTAVTEQVLNGLFLMSMGRGDFGVAFYYLGYLKTGRI